MSEQNVETLRAIYAEWAKGNFWAARDLFAPDAVLEQIAEPGAVYRGRDAIAGYIREFLAQWSEFRIEAEEIVDAGAVVVVAERQYAKGKASGVETETTFYSVWTFDDDLVVNVRWELDRQSALEAAGLSE